jgi:hypothetical protein
MVTLNKLMIAKNTTLGHTNLFHDDPSLLPKTTGLWYLNEDFEKKKKKKIARAFLQFGYTAVRKMDGFFYLRIGLTMARVL